ncbi:MAG TPA: hypothetical protein PL131_11250 [Methylotenera sp.]|nr:hypothetical protein [Methylotenera sp.]HPH06443.1 hypothetical protein [Methylotenera sp.]HPN00410.1 hypothetical protein [Methylotenera sp.]
MLIKFLLKLLLLAVTATALSSCNSIPARRADEVVVKAVTRGTLPVRRELARTFSHAVQCAIGTRYNCDEFNTNPNESVGNQNEN